MAGSDYAKPRSPDRSQPQQENRPGFGATTPEIGKSPGYRFFDRKVIPPKQTLDYWQFLHDPNAGLGVLEFLKKESIQSVEEDYDESPSSDAVLLERTEPILVEGITRLPWSRDLGDHEIRLAVEYTVDTKGDEPTFHIVLYITATPLERKRPKFREQTIAYAFDHRGTRGAGKKKWKASAGGGSSQGG